MRSKDTNNYITSLPRRTQPKVVGPYAFKTHTKFRYYKIYGDFIAFVGEQFDKDQD